MDIKSNIFKDKNLGKQFQEKGFVKMPFLTKQELEDVRRYYDDTIRNIISASPNHSGNLFTIDIMEKELRTSIFEKISELLDAAVQRNFSNYQKILGSFILKNKEKEDNFINAHQDWTFVDEDEYYSAVLWVPLVDTNMQNGTLGVVPGSHKWPTNFSGTPSHAIKNPYSSMGEYLMQYFEFIHCNAGDVIIWNSRTLHGSMMNKTPSDRPVISISLTRDEAVVNHYYKIPNIEEYQLAKYDMDLEMLLGLNIANAAKKYDEGEMLFGYHKSFSIINDKPLDISIETVEKWIKEAGLEKNPYVVFE